MKRQKGQRSEAEFNLATVRQWKRQARRLVRSLEEVERALLKMRPRPSPEHEGLCYHAGLPIHQWNADTCPPAARKNRKPDLQLARG